MSRRNYGRPPVPPSRRTTDDLACGEQVLYSFRIELEGGALRQAGQLAVQMIAERTRRGEDAGGRPFAPYSTRPFAMPAGATTKRARKALEGQGLLSYFTTKRGTLWMLVEGGYQALKAARYVGGGQVVDLTGEGSMLQALAVVEVDERARRVVVGFSRAEEAQKAAWHQFGAGHLPEPRTTFSARAVSIVSSNLICSDMSLVLMLLAVATALLISGPIYRAITAPWEWGRRDSTLLTLGVGVKVHRVGKEGDSETEEED